MKNSQEEVKQVAFYETKDDNNHNGVLKTICEVLKIPLSS